MVRITGLMSTAASRAWLGVAFVGLATVVLVVVMALIPRMSAGQDVVAAAGPAFTDERVAGTRAGVELVSQYVDFADPLLTARGGADKEVRSLLRLIGRELGLTSAQARKILRREAPYAEALMRALPLEDVAEEIPVLTSYLATTLNVSEDQLAATLEQSFPRLAQVLTTLPIVTGAWYDVPGIEGLTRLSRAKPVRTVPGLRKYVRDDVVALTAEHTDEVRSLAGTGGIGYIGWLLALVGLVLLVYGLAQSRRAADKIAPGRFSWNVVVAIGALVIALVAAGQYVPRLSGGQKLVSDLAPVFAQDRANGAAIGFETIHEAVVLGDPIMTSRGGAYLETPQLYRLVAQRTGSRSGDVRRALMRRAPRTIALLDALPMTRVARDVPRLLAYLAKALRMEQDAVVALLRRRAPGLTQALLAAPTVTAGWNEVPGTGELTRFDGVTPVRTLPAVDDYLRQDLLDVFVEERAHFEAFAGRSPPLDAIAPAMLILGIVVLLYGGAMLLVARRH